MALRIIPATEPIHVERLNVVIYAAPGLGKTTLAFTADDPLLLDFDRGAHRSGNRRDSAKIEDWSEVAGITRADVADYKTVILDTAGRALDALTTDIIRRNSKLGSAGALNLKGFGQLKAEFIAFLKMLNGFGKDVVLIAHMDEQRSGDEIIERLDVQGGSKGEIYKAADAMGRLMIRDGRRVLTFSPTDTAFGKNPGYLPELVVPEPGKDPRFLGNVIEQTKARLNELTAEQTAAATLQLEWRAKLDALPTTASAFNALLPEVKAQPRVVQALFHHEAKRRGLKADPATSSYTGGDPEPAVAEAVAAPADAPVAKGKAKAGAA